MTARRPRAAWLLGPALVAGVAYLDPGNVASNMTAGARYGYLLVWVVVLGNVMAWLIQYLSAKLGVVTGRSLSQTLGERIRRPWARRAYWLQAELVAMATDIAEIIGGAVAGWRRIHAHNALAYTTNAVYTPNAARLFEKGWLE